MHHQSQCIACADAIAELGFINRSIARSHGQHCAEDEQSIIII